MKTSAEERRKKFENWFSPKMYRDAKGIVLPATSEASKWKEEEIKCFDCKRVYGSVYKNKDGNWYCLNCSEPIEGLEEYKNRE